MCIRDSGKTAVLIEAAVSAARKKIGVLIICPTGQLVHALKTQLPDEEGIENVEVNTIHGVLQYKRPGADTKVKWSPPSALRRIDLILIDEASQYDDKEWVRLMQCILEQPQSPFTAATADFQQLQPLSSGKCCRAHCESMPRVTLNSVYRTNDPEHLLFLNRIRCEQHPPALRAKPCRGVGNRPNRYFQLVGLLMRPGTPSSRSSFSRAELLGQWRCTIHAKFASASQNSMLCQCVAWIV